LLTLLSLVNFLFYVASKPHLKLISLVGFTMAMKNASVKHNSNGLLLELLEYGDIVKAISSAIYHPGSMYLGAWIVANHFKWNDDPSLACNSTSNTNNRCIAYATLPLSFHLARAEGYIPCLLGYQSPTDPGPCLFIGSCSNLHLVNLLA
jgi:hypothetical protein